MSNFNKTNFKTFQLKVFLLLWAPYFAVNAFSANLELSHVPLSTNDSAAPNLAFTFDDSGSMSSGFMPNEIDSFSTYHAAKSAYVNQLTYNPAITYQPGVDAYGVELPQATFLNAILGINTVNNKNEVIDIYRVIAGGLNPDNFAVDLSKNYRHPWFLLSDSEDLQFALEEDDVMSSGENSGQPAYYYIWNNTLTACDQDSFNDACYEKKIVQTSEKQNFANWYQYHSLRLTAGKSAISTAFTNMPSVVRLARQTINQLGLNSGENNNFIAAFSNNEKLAFYNWLFSISPSGATPLRGALITAGEFFSQSDDDNAYERFPGSKVSGADDIVSCRSNYHVMFTDGYYSKEMSMKLFSIGDFDQHSISQGNWPGPSEYAYQPDDLDMLIYSGSGTSSLADIAFYYWARDLQLGEEFENNVSPVIRTSFSELDELSKQEYWDPKNDPSTWQNMVNYIIGMGVSGKYDANSEEDYQALITGEADWLKPVPVDPDDINNLNARIDDLWHAAISSRGQYYSVASSSDFEQALNDIILSFKQSFSSVAPVSVNSRSLSNGAALYQGGFETNHWTGFLKMFLISDGSLTELEDSNSCNAKPAGSVCETDVEVDNASIADWDQRRVYSYDPDQSLNGKGITLTGGSNLRWGELSQQQKKDLGADFLLNTAKQRLDYVLGDKKFEEGENNGGHFRNRTNEQRILGAIIHGGPLFVGNGTNADGSFSRFYPDYITPSDNTYANFLTRIKDRPAMIYAGAADGKLHAYSAEDLTEEFSFIPDAVFPNLDDFSEKSFSFWPFVDGPLKEGDVFFNNSWHTLLLGSFRSSAFGLYALDITSPQAFSENDVLWEYTERRFPGDNDLGHIYDEPSIVRTAKGSNANNQASGEWMLSFGNGYNSANGHAVLYFLDPETGETLVKIDTDVGPESGVDSVGNAINHDYNVIEDMPNGLGAPTIVDNNGDFRADFAYASDFFGNLWRFDLRDSNVSNWSVKLVYAAKDKNSVPQTITAKPVVGRHPEGDPGLIVYFGTGKNLELSDVDATNVGVQTFYGIWDRVDTNVLIDLDNDGNTANDDFHVVNGFERKHLLQQNIIQQSAFDDQENIEVRTVSSNPIKYFSGKGLPDSDDGYLGWYLDLNTEAGERVTTQAVLRGSNIIFITQTPFTDVCKGGAGSWLMELSARTGGTSRTQALDNNDDGLINTGDYHEGSYTGGWKNTELGSYTIPAILYDKKTRLEHKIMSTGSGKVSSLAEQPPIGDTGRQAWRKLR